MRVELVFVAFLLVIQVAKSKQKCSVKKISANGGYFLSCDGGFEGGTERTVVRKKERKRKVGPPGPQGPQGFKGEKGETGLKGDEGPMGPIGLTGLRGPRGNTGLVGEKGDMGDFGVPGPQGAPGLPGNCINDEMLTQQNNKKYYCVSGPRGPPGQPGIMGSRGERGFQGEEGRPGKQGPKGGRRGTVGMPGLPGSSGAVRCTQMYTPWVNRLTSDAQEEMMCPFGSFMQGLKQERNEKEEQRYMFVCCKIE